MIILIKLEFTEFDEFGKKKLFLKAISNLSNDFQLDSNSKIDVLNTEKCN